MNYKGVTGGPQAKKIPFSGFLFQSGNSAMQYCVFGATLISHTKRSCELLHHGILHCFQKVDGLVDFAHVFKVNVV